MLVATRLPLELRNEIYSYIWDEEVVNSLNMHFGPEPGSYSITIPDFLDTDKVEPQYLTEAVTWLYSNYRGLGIETWEEIDDFLNTDIFGVGVMPSACELRGLTMYLEADWASPWDYERATARHCFTQLSKTNLSHDFWFTLQFIMRHWSGNAKVDELGPYCLLRHRDEIHDDMAVLSACENVKVSIKLHVCRDVINIDFTDIMHKPVDAWKAKIKAIKEEKLELLSVSWVFRAINYILNSARIKASPLPSQGAVNTGSVL
jgi:hypothetical protein